MKLFLTHVCDLLEDTDPSTICETTVFKELDEWSSLMALSLIAMIDEIYDVTIGAEDIRNANTLADLYNAIKN